MPELRDLLERRAARYEPPDDLFDRVLDRHLRRDRNRRIGTGVVATVLAVAAIGVGGRAFVVDREAGPALSGPGPSPADQPSTRLMGLDLPGVWVQTSAVEPAPHKVLTFTADGTFAMEVADRDGYGVFDAAYRVRGDTITFTDLERGCMRMRWTAGHPAGGEAVPSTVDLAFTITDTGAGGCTAPSGFDVEGMRLYVVRISPRSLETDSWEMRSEYEAGRHPQERSPSLPDLAGIWFQDDGEHVLRISPAGEYTIGVGEAFVTDPANSGTIALGDGGTIELTTGPGSETCGEGTVMTWREVRVARYVLWSDVEDDPCGGLRAAGIVSWHNLLRY